MQNMILTKNYSIALVNPLMDFHPNKLKDYQNVSFFFYVKN